MNLLSRHVKIKLLILKANSLYSIPNETIIQKDENNNLNYEGGNDGFFYCEIFEVYGILSHL